MLKEQGTKGIINYHGYLEPLADRALPPPNACPATSSALQLAILSLLSDLGRARSSAQT